MKKKPIRLNESQLKRIIKESVKKAIMNEISSDMIARARDKFIQKYGNNAPGSITPGEMDQSLEKDKYGRKLHPKTKKPLYWHQSNFENAYAERRFEEHPEYAEKAREIFNTFDILSDYDRCTEVESGEAISPDENWSIFEIEKTVKDPKTGQEWWFCVDCYGHYTSWDGYDLVDEEMDDITEDRTVYFEAPDGASGNFKI